MAAFLLLINQNKSKKGIKKMNETMTKTLFGYLIDVEGTGSGPVEIEKSLKSYYQTLNCELISIFYFEISGKEYCVIYDDEGLLKTNPKVTAISGHNGNPVLYGNILITGTEDDEDFSSISYADVENIEKAIMHVIDQKQVRPIILVY